MKQLVGIGELLLIPHNKNIFFFDTDCNMLYMYIFIKKPIFSFWCIYLSTYSSTQLCMAPRKELQATLQELCHALFTFTSLTQYLVYIIPQFHLCLSNLLISKFFRKLNVRQYKYANYFCILVHTLGLGIYELKVGHHM